MAEKAPPQPLPPRRLALINVAVVALGLGLYFIFHRPTPRQTTINQQPARIAAVTPRAYTMITGTITALDPATKTMTVDFSYIDQAGKNKTKKYNVTAGASTVLQSVNQSSTPAEVATIDFATLAVGDRVDALGEENLAPLDAFTAATVLQYLR